MPRADANAATNLRYHPTAQALLDDASKLRPHPMNPNSGDVDALARSVVENGVYRCVWAWDKTGEILAGHTLYDALVGVHGQTRVPIGWVAAESKAEAIKILLADNRYAQLGRLDEGLLLAALDELAEQGAGHEGTGYTPEDIDGIRAMLDDAVWDAARQPDVGEPDDEAFLPRIDLRVPSTVFDAWRLFLDEHDGANDADKLARALTALGFLDV